MKILAIGFHGGALESLHHVIPDIDTWCVPIEENGFHYNMTHDRAEILWGMYKDKFNSYDTIITTDTTPISRIFLQNNYKGRLIIWICNRFDYADGDFVFDKEYYGLMEKANFDKNVRIAAYSKYDRIHSFRAGVLVDEIIKPTFNPELNYPEGIYYMPDYQNNYTFNIAEKCNFNVKTGRHETEELKTFKAIIHLPYHWQGVAEMKALQYCIPYYVPSKKLFFNLLATGKYWFQNQSDLYKYLEVCNFYDKENKAIYYFDSLDKINDIEIDREKIFKYASELFTYNKRKWKHLLWN